MELVVDLAIDARDFKRLYAGTVRDVYAVSRDGLRVRFPARHLRPFVTASGVYGRFELCVDGGRLAAIRRLS